MPETFRERLARLVPKGDMKKVSLAAGLGATYVRDIVRGRSQNPKLSGLVALANALSLDVGEFVHPEDMAAVDDDTLQRLTEIITPLDLGDRQRALRILGDVFPPKD